MGGLPEGVEQNETVTLTVGKDPIHLVLRTQSLWTYDPNAKTITNGDWILNVHVPDSKYPNNLGLGDGSWVNGNAYNVDGKNGFLDLSGLILDSEKNQYKLTHINQAAFRATTSHPCPIARIVFPKSIVSANRTFLSNESNPVLATPLEEVEIDWPDFTGVLPAQALLQQTSLSKLILKVPLVKKIDNYFMQNSKNLSATVCTTDFDLSSVEEICQYAFNETKMSGVLSLPSITNIGYKAFQGCSKISYAILGTNYKITDYMPLILAKQTFNLNSALKTIEFGPYDKYNTADKNAFEGCTYLRKVTFTGRPPSAEFLSDLVQSAAVIESASSASKTLVIYGSANLGWNDVVCKDAVSDVEPFTISSKESANAPELEEGQRILGVYKTLDGSRKAWIVHQASEFDPRGTILIIR